MKPKVLQALLSASSEVRAAADELLARNSRDVIDNLLSKVKILESAVDDLQSVEEPELSDADASALIEAFTARLAEVTAPELIRYGYAEMRSYQKPVRVLIANMLIERAKKLEVKPNDLWLDIVALGGGMK